MVSLTEQLAWCRYGSDADAAPRGRATSSRADPTWGRADATAPAQQRVLRKRDPRGRGATQEGSERMQETRHEPWHGKEQLGGSASQGMPVLTHSTAVGFAD